MRTIPKTTRLQFIKRWTQEPIEMKQLVAMCCVNWGLSRRTILEDIKVLIDFGSLEQNGQTIQVRQTGSNSSDRAENEATVKGQEAQKKD